MSASLSRTAMLVAACAALCAADVAASAETMGAHADFAADEALFAANFAGAPHTAASETLVFRLLAKEAATVASGVPLDERETEYFASLVGYVSTSEFNDPVEVLLLPSVLASGGMATSALAKWGERSLPRIFAALETYKSDETYRFGITRLIEAMLLEDKGVDPAARGQLAAYLSQALGDADPYIRMSAIHGLQKSLNTELARTIDAMAENDPFYVVDGPTVAYPVRDEARRVLRSY